MFRNVFPILVAAALAVAGADRGEFIPIPFLFSYPETGLGGGLKLRWQDPMGAPGYTDLTALTSVKGQSDLDGTWERDSLGGRWRLKVFGEVGKFPGKWFGTGDPPSDSLEGVYTPRYVGGYFQATRLLPEGFTLGARTRLEETSIRTDGRGIFARTPDWYGAKGGTDFDLTFVAEHEGRDSRSNPSEGSFASIQFLTGLPGGDFEWNDATFDASEATSMGSFTAVGRVHHEEAWGEVPFWQVPALGWRKSLRGLPDKRLRGRAVQCVGLETRWNAGTFHGVPLQPALFGEVGRAGDHDEVWTSDLRWAAGLGLRCPLAQGKAVLRADYGWSDYGSGLYIDFGQAF
jgi:outer membrane protein assembly factor BamA